MTHLEPGMVSGGCQEGVRRVSGGCLHTLAQTERGSGGTRLPWTRGGTETPPHRCLPPDSCKVPDMEIRGRLRLEAPLEVALSNTPAQSRVSWRMLPRIMPR